MKTTYGLSKDDIAFVEALIHRLSIDLAKKDI